jgi:hypothetical protein
MDLPERPPRDARHRRARLDTAAGADILDAAVRGKAAETEGKATSMIGTRKRAGFRSVLCPVDFSEHSRRALEYGAAIALDAKAALHVVYVTDPLLVAARQPHFTIGNSPGEARVSCRSSSTRRCRRRSGSDWASPREWRSGPQPTRSSRLPRATDATSSSSAHAASMPSIA